MKVEKIIHYLLIGNLNSGRIIYEMPNKTDPKTIYDINQIFNSYHKQHHHKPENSKIDNYYMMITIERIIMISKTDPNLPFRQNFELFKKINEGIPELAEMSLNWNLPLHKKSLNLKISEKISEFFAELNSNKIMNTVSFKRNRSAMINKIYTNNYYNEEQMNMRIRNSLISNLNNNISFDADKYSFTQMIQDKSNRSINSNLDKSNKIMNNKISVRIFDDNKEQDKTNINKSLIQSNITINNNINKMRTQQELNQLPYGLLRELQNIIWNISCCKKIIIVVLIIIIITQIIIIPVVIHSSYSY